MTHASFIVSLVVCAATLTFFGCKTDEPIHHLHRLSDRLYSGAAPEGEAAFAHLADLGVKTIITVDGAKPDAELAGRYGLRYIHLPIGYDGIESDQATRIVAVARDSDGPVFIHCHHGLHRGPTAAALCGVALEGWSNEHAVQWMRQTGKTSADYAGLYATAADFAAPDATTLDAIDTKNLPAVAEVGDTVDAMVAIDKRWEHLKAVRAAGWAVPPGHADIDPAHEALLLNELYVELTRYLRQSKADPALIERMNEAAKVTDDLHQRLAAVMASADASTREAAERSFAAVATNCKSCHKSFRN